MRVTAELRYIDTCCLMMFINDRDIFRNYYGMGKKRAENCMSKALRPFTIPIPALGEAVYKIRDKSGEKWMDSLKELNRLIDLGFLNITYLQNSTELYKVAKELCRPVNDDRDRISPTDALIVAAATVDPDCSTLYTTDSVIITDTHLTEYITAWREDIDFPPLAITDLSSILKY